MVEPRVSVVIPCFNYGRFVAAAVDSALAQDWPDLEVIVVDDGSTDGSREVLARFGSAIRLITQQNRGVNAATDAGIAAAEGELITFLDADDTWPAQRIRVLAHALQGNPHAGAVYGDMTVVGDRGEIIHPSFNAYKGFADPPSGRFLGPLLSFNCVSAGAMMVRASLRELFHPIPAHGGWHDWWIATQILREHEIVAIRDSVNIYRQHDSNKNLGADDARTVSLLRTELAFRQWLIAHTAPPLVTLGDLVQGLATLDWSIERIARFDGRAPADFLAEQRTPAHSAYRKACELICAGDFVSGAAGLVAASAQAPTWPIPRVLLEELLGAMRAGNDDAPPTAGRVEAVALDELLANPAQLTQWADNHRGQAGATLVIFGVTDPSDEAATVALVERLGLADADLDLLAVPDRDPASVAIRLRRRLDAFLQWEPAADAA